MAGCVFSGLCSFYALSIIKQVTNMCILFLVSYPQLPELLIPHGRMTQTDLFRLMCRKTLVI